MAEKNKAPAAAGFGRQGGTGAITGEATPLHDSTAQRPEPKRHTSHSRNPWENVPPEVMQVARNARAAREWAEAQNRLRQCPEAKALIWGTALAEVEAKRRFSFARVVKDVADKHITTRTGESFRVNNNHISAYARMFLAECPQARKYMNKPRESMYDFLAAARQEEKGERWPR